MRIKKSLYAMIKILKCGPRFFKVWSQIFHIIWKYGWRNFCKKLLIVFLKCGPRFFISFESMDEVIFSKKLLIVIWKVGFQLRSLKHPWPSSCSVPLSFKDSVKILEEFNNFLELGWTDITLSSTIIELSSVLSSLFGKMDCNIQSHLSLCLRHFVTRTLCAWI